MKSKRDRSGDCGEEKLFLDFLTLSIRLPWGGGLFLAAFQTSEVVRGLAST